MPYYPTLRESYSQIQTTDVFMGYNHNLKIQDGEFFEMENLTSDFFPLLANRGKRGTVRQLTAPGGLLAKASLACVDDGKLIYGGEDITGYLRDKGASISPGEKNLVSMGAYILIFPDKLYLNTEDFDDCGFIEQSTSASGSISYSICKADGSAYEDAVVSDTAPEEPVNGQLWIDSSGALHVLNQYSSTSAMWVQVPTVYTKIQATGIGAGFAKYDGVTIAGCEAEGDLSTQIAALNGSQILYDCGEDYIVIIGLLDGSYTQTKGSVSVARRMPDMDFVTESENRLWGCKYGVVNGETLNEIYCCALGDFKNWSQYLGLSTDSYTASVGTDGPWTGAVTHLGYPLFFKENVMHKVYISATGAHRIVDTTCRGVQQGSHKSLVVVNERLYYKGTTDVCVYDGSLPQSVSEQFGTEKYYDAAAGFLGDKYYISMRDRKNEWHLFVYDTLRGFWHREDNTHATAFARFNGDLFYITEQGSLMCVNASEGIEEQVVPWRADTGMIGYATVEQKYVSRFNLRMRLPVGSSIDVYIQYDSDGVWNYVGHIEGTGTNTFTLPIRPRRCDHFQIRFAGRGELRVYSFSRNFERGSDM